MYLPLLAALCATVIAVVVLQVGGGWFLAILAGLVTMVAIMIVAGRRLSRRLAPVLAQARRQIESGMLGPALETFRGILPLGNWVPMLRGQIHAQIGMIAFQAGKKDQAIEHLKQAAPRVTEAQILLASILDRGGDAAAARQVLDRAAPRQKDSDLFQNVQAYILHRQGETTEAIRRLAKFCDKRGGEASHDNLLRLRNDRKMNMKPFGLPWFMLGYERPPASMGQMQTGAKGFRQPPKRKRKGG